VRSSGLHANGASLARLLADRLADGYASRLPSGATLGESLLEPSLLYAPLVAAILERGPQLSYISHVTGHGLLKLMRPAQALRYRIARLPPVPEVLSFIVAQAGLDARAAYSTFNMGVGYALYCRARTGETLVAIAAELGFQAEVAGAVEEGPREVVLEPVDVRFGDRELDLSAHNPEPQTQA
jgi:phosphoribosylformylglycinamidine cyclo-ligase